MEDSKKSEKYREDSVYLIVEIDAINQQGRNRFWMPQERIHGWLKNF